MMHRPWSSIVEVPYCFSRSNIKFQGHTALKIVKFYRNWAFLDSNSSLNSLMVMKCCTKLETAKERCPIVFQSHPSNFKVTRDKTSPLLTRIGRFRTIGRSQLSNPSDLPCFYLLTWIIADLLDGLVQEKRNSSALAMELRLSCNNPSCCQFDLWYSTSVELESKCQDFLSRECIWKCCVLMFRHQSVDHKT